MTDKTSQNGIIGKLLMGIVIVATLISIFFFIRLIIDSASFR
jgi:hypothetical protein